MYHQLKRNRNTYGQRWQVETGYSMIKRNLSDELTARSYWPQCRELRLLVITHNILILLIIKVSDRALPTAYSCPFSALMLAHPPLLTLALSSQRQSVIGADSRATPRQPL